MIPKVILVWSDGQAPTTTDISESQGRELQVDQISSRKLGIYEIRFSRFQYSTAPYVDLQGRGRIVLERGVFKQPFFRAFFCGHTGAVGIWVVKVSCIIR